MPPHGTPRTQAVLFDYGLTLVTFSFPRECLLQMLEEVRPDIAQATGIDAPAGEVLLRTVLEPIEDRLPDLGDDEIDYVEFYAAAWHAAGLRLPAGLLHRILDAEQRCWDSAVETAPGLFGALEKLRGMGLRLAVCSNAPFPPAMMHRQVASLGLTPLLDAVVFSSEIGRRKPAPELYRAALDRVGVEPQAALYVGDRPREDYDGPRRLGMRAVLCRALARAPIPPGIPTIASLTDLPAVL
jgi:HAD superfamily hydrolase (TIGR01509 family)